MALEQNLISCTIWKVPKPCQNRHPMDHRKLTLIMFVQQNIEIICLHIIKLHFYQTLSISSISACVVNSLFVDKKCNFTALFCLPDSA